MVKTEDSKDDIVEIVDINKEKVLEMPVSKLAANDSDSDVLVIDEEDEVPPKPTEQVSRPAKRKRKSTSKGEELPPAKTSRRSSTQNSTKKFEQVENELEAMFAGIDQKTPEKATIQKKPVVSVAKEGNDDSYLPEREFVHDMDCNDSGIY